MAVTMILLLCLSFVVACNGGEKPIEDIPQTTDNYRTYYQIFPYSFADSDGNGIGDIQGIIDKLDYIADMHFDGLWLTPVHRSTTYHKYDVIDYKSIDGQFGTMDDYDRLVEECHKRGMTILLDLVLNHTSAQHEWFKDCMAAHEAGVTDYPTYNYYNVQPGHATSSTWHDYGSWRYECQFWDQMPDLNWQYILDEPNGNLANDIKDIMRFWLIDHKVDGFRLDATAEFFSGNDAKNQECLKWINDTAKSIKPDCYIVGEGPWGTKAYAYHDSGIDSFFLFNHGYQGTGSISMSARNMDNSGFYYFSNIDARNEKELNSFNMPALFVANHDTPRAYGILLGGVKAQGLNNMKLGYGVMAMSAGSTFWYYGDEIGMNAFPATTGKKEVIDEHKRQPMPWGDSYQCRPVSGTDLTVEDSVKYPWGDVNKNLKNDDSLLNYITRANALRRAFPQIARNYGKVVYDGEFVGIVSKGSGDDIIYIAVNLSHSEESSIQLSQYIGDNVKIAGTLSVDKIASLKDGVLKLPPMAFAVLKAA